MKITITGSSDDIVMVEGDIRDEFYPADTDDFYIAVSDGTLLKGRYDDEGMWRFTQRFVGSATFAHATATDPDDDYSDQVIMEGDAIRWVALATHFAK